VSAADDGTIDLLTNTEGQLIAALGRGGMMTPTQAARQLARSRYWVGVDAEALRKLGLVEIHRLPKQTTYELTGQGMLLLEPVTARITRSGRFLTSAEVDGYVPAGTEVVERDTDGTALRGPSLPCGCPLDSGCDGQHPGRLP
jgi:hypothetical protein